MFKRFRYRIYPNASQAQMFAKTFGCVRWVYNWGIEQREKVYKESKGRISRFELAHKVVLLKKEKETEWLREVDSQCLAQSLRHLEAAYIRFFKTKKGFPKFKSKIGKQSFTCTQHLGVCFKSGFIKIPKIKPIRAILHRKFRGKINTITIIRVPSGKFFASVLVEIKSKIHIKPIITEQESIGIDLGLKEFCTLSTGEKISNPKCLYNSGYKLKKLQRQLSRKEKGSNRRKKAVIRLARLHEKISNQRLDFLHKLSLRIIRENQTVCIEDLNVKGMLKNHSLARTISDSGWSKFIRLLEYKSDWYSSNLLRVGRFEPSTKMCSCGVINNDLTLSDREWTCIKCGKTHDRDVLAAQNIKRFALRNVLPEGQELTLRDSRRNKATG